MSGFKMRREADSGFTVLELCAVLAGMIILLGAAVPMLDNVINQYRFTLVAQNIATELQFARMKAVSSNESFRVNFPANQRFYQVETNAGDPIAGPFWLPDGVNITEVTFGGRFVSFSPVGDASTVGNGSAGRVKIVSRLGKHIDIIVGTGGIVRQTPVY